MKNIYLLLLLVFTSCQKDIETVNTYSIEIYGNDNCYYTTKLRNECTKSNINFQYLSLSTFDNVQKEMTLTNKYFSSRITTTTYVYEGQTIIQRTSDLNLPIVLIIYNKDISCLERPSIEDVKKIIKFN